MSGPFERAQVLLEQGRYDLAEKELRSALAADPDNAAAHALLAECLLQLEKLDDATREAQAAIHGAPDFWFSHWVLARILLERNRYDEAETATNEAIRLAAAEPGPVMTLAGIRLAQRNWPGALEAAERGLQLDPEHVGLNNVRAAALVRLGRRAEAGATLDSVLARQPENAMTHANKGWGLLDKGDPKEALVSFREALRLDPTSEWARAGVVEALKARNPIYGFMLRYFMWMSKLSGKAQWAIILIGFVGSRALRGIADTNKTVAPFVWPVIIAYSIFAVMTWISAPLFNLFLRLHRDGRHALSRDQVVASNWFGVCLLAALLSLGIWAATGQVVALWPALVFGLLLIPVAGTFACDPGWPRWAMAAITIGLLLVGAGGPFLAVFLQRPGVVSGSLTLFLLGIFASQWIAAGLASVTVRK